MIAFIAAIAPTEFLAVGTAAPGPGRHHGAGRADQPCLTNHLAQGASPMTVPGASTGRDYEQGVAGPSRRPCSCATYVSRRSARP
jgi:hypothetical protein